REIGLRRPGDRTGPRVHDFRHTFAIRTLLGWYRSGGDVEKKLPALSTYLGHACVRDGSVARTIAEVARTGTTSIRSPLCSAVEHGGDEDRLCSDIAPVDISNLTLPDHRHRL